MSERNSGTAHDLFEKHFPGEKYTTTFEPTAAQRVATTRLAQHHAVDGDELKAFMMALGLMAYDSKPVERVITGVCKRGHDRATHSKVRADGFLECMICKRAMRSARKRAA